MSANALESNPADTETIAPGVVVGGRFQIENAGPTGAFGQTFHARDQKTKKPIAVYVLSDAIGGDRATVEIFRNEARSAAKLKHRNLVAIYGVGAHAGRQQFIAQEWLSGHTAAELMQERKAADRTLSVRGVYNLVTHVCKALTAIHELSVHGTLRPQVVWISKSGRVKVGELGVSATVAKTRRWELLQPEEQAYLAPEVRTGAPADKRSDVFGAGALLYTLLTGRSPLEPFVPPSQARDDVTPELDALLLRCLATDPQQRFASPEELVANLLPLCADAPEPARPDFDVDVEVDVDVAHSVPPPGGKKSPAPPPLAKKPVEASLPPIEIAIGVSMTPAAMSLAPNPVSLSPNDIAISVPVPAPSPAPAKPLPPMAAGNVPPARPAPPSAAGLGAPPPAARLTPAKPMAAVAANDQTENLAEITARLMQNDAPRWMAVKDGMDHGPFTARELIKLIVDGEIREQHFVFTLSSAERKPLAEYPEFSEFVHQFKLRKEEKDHHEALARSTKIEKRSTAAKALILSASIGALLLVGVGYLMSRRAADERKHQAELDLAALYESGQVKISGTAGILTHTPRPGGARRSAGSQNTGASPGGFTSYEDAMNQAMELDMGKSGGERQLTSSDVAGVMNKSLNGMFSCVGEELRRGGKLGRVTIDVAILGSGRVLGASVNAGSAGFQKCVAGKVRGIQFPSFPAPRMGARYSFAVD